MERGHPVLLFLTNDKTMQRNSMDKDIHLIRFDDEFKICPLCGYKDGFHSMLERDGEKVKWLFICPSCHQVFDIGRTLE
jgi:hypothetical protein